MGRTNPAVLGFRVLTGLVDVSEGLQEADLITLHCTRSEDQEVA